MNMYAYVANDPINAKDPSGEFALIGAVIGAAADLAVQAISGDISKNGVDWGSVAQSAAIGAVTGGIGNLAALATAGKVLTISKTGIQSVGTVGKAERVIAGTHAAGLGAGLGVATRDEGDSVIEGAAEGAVDAFVPSELNDASEILTGASVGENLTELITEGEMHSRDDVSKEDDGI